MYWLLLFSRIWKYFHVISRRRGWRSTLENTAAAGGFSPSGARGRAGIRVSRAGPEACWRGIKNACAVICVAVIVRRTQRTRCPPAHQLSFQSTPWLTFCTGHRLCLKCGCAYTDRGGAIAGAAAELGVVRLWFCNCTHGHVHLTSSICE